MQAVRKISADLFWVGADDRRTALFENMFPLPNGISYNSYVILDKKTAVLDTADESVLSRFLENVEAVLGGRALDYLIVHHMEPDHCSGIARLLRRYPDCRMAASAKAFALYEQFYHETLPEARRLVLKEGDTLCLGTHTLRFISAPMVHWPEVLMSYEETEKILFSADAFGTFGALSGNLFAEELPWDTAWQAEARRYYSNIVGKYGQQVQAVLKKTSALEISAIAPLHGPVWRGELLPAILRSYALWSSYQPEEPGTAVIFCASMYGNTEELCDMLACALAERGLKGVRVYDVSKTDKSWLVAECFRCAYPVFAAPTYNNGLYPKMKELLEDLAALQYGNRKCTVLGNGSWAPQSEKLMREALLSMKGMDVSGKTIVLKSRLSEAQLPEVEAVAEDILARLGDC